MKVLLISNNLRRGGASVGANNLKKALRQLGHEVICVDKYSSNSFLLRCIRGFERVLEKLFLLPVDSHFIKVGPATLDLRNLVEEHKPDIVQFCFVAGNIVDFGEIEELKVPTFLRLSDFWPFLGPNHYLHNNTVSPFQRLRIIISNFIFKATYDLSALTRINVVAPSCWTADILRNEDITVSSINYIPNAVDVDPDYDYMKKSTESINMMIVAEDLSDPRKGVKDFLKFVDLHWKGIRLELTLVGNNGSNVIKDASIDGNNLNICCKGNLPRLSVLDLLKNCSFLVCPSNSDNSPNVITEAFSLGVPVICQTGTGSSSYVINGYNGFIFNFRNIDDEQSFSTIVMKSDISKLRSHAFQDSKEKYDLPVIGQKYTELYQEALKGVSAISIF